MVTKRTNKNHVKWEIHQLYVKNKLRPLPDAIKKSQIKMNETP